MRSLLGPCAQPRETPRVVGNKPGLKPPEIDPFLGYLPGSGSFGAIAGSSPVAVCGLT